MVCTLDEASYHYFRPSVMHLIWYCFVLVLNSLLSDLSTLQGYVECVKWYCHHAMHCMKFHIPVQKSEASLWSPTSELLLCLISRRTLHRWAVQLQVYGFYPCGTSYARVLAVVVCLHVRLCVWRGSLPVKTCATYSPKVLCWNNWWKKTDGNWRTEVHLESGHWNWDGGDDVVVKCLSLLQMHERVRWLQSWVCSWPLGVLLVHLCAGAFECQRSKCSNNQ